MGFIAEQGYKVNSPEEIKPSRAVALSEQSHTFRPFSQADTQRVWGYTDPRKPVASLLNLSTQNEQISIICEGCFSNYSLVH